MTNKDWSVVIIILMVIVGIYYTFFDNVPRSNKCDNTNCLREN